MRERQNAAPRPCEILLELFRASDAGDPFAFSLKEQEYVRRLEDGDLENARFPWSDEALAELEAIQREDADPEAGARLGQAIRGLLMNLKWAPEEEKIRRAIDENRSVIITLRLAAAELFALPWELVPFGAAGVPLGSLPGCLLRYEWPGTRTASPEPAPEGLPPRVVLAWSAAGGAVPAEDHVNAVRRAARAAHYEGFNEGRDVIAQASPDRIRAALTSPAGPAAVLHLLCHGGRIESTTTSYGLVLDPDGSAGDVGGDTVIDAKSLQLLLAEHGRSLRLVVLCACHAGNPGALENRLASVAQELHRAGVPAVVASRYPLAVDASVELAEALYQSLLVDGASLESAFLAVRDKLRRHPSRIGWASLQLYARASDGPAHWPTRAPPDEHEAAVASPAAPSRSSEPPPSDPEGPPPYCEVTVALHRATDAGDPYAFALEEQSYLRHKEGGGARSASFPWGQEVLERLAAVQREKADANAVARIGAEIGVFLKALGWDADEPRIFEALEQRKPIFITLRLGAAELFALPWERVPLGGAGVPLGSLNGCVLRYEWPETTTAKPEPDPPPEGGRVLFAWSAAGGAVPAAEHLNAIRKAVVESRSDSFDEARDVVAHASLASLGEALRARPVAVLHLLCHGGELERSGSFGLALNPERAGREGREIVDARAFQLLLKPHLGSVRLVVLCACYGGDSGALDSRLGSVAQELHRAGVPAVVASRYPLAVDASIKLAEALYHGLFISGLSLERSFLEARSKLEESAARSGWSSLQLYARAADGPDHRPIVPRPFRGLLTFQEAHAAYFVGREGEVAEAMRDLSALMEGGAAGAAGAAGPGSRAAGAAGPGSRAGSAVHRPRFLMITGASGTGKSSMLMAGVIPALRARDPGVVVAFLRPTPDFKARIAAALASRADPAANLLIVVDQFEEIFTAMPFKRAREDFVNALLAPASDPASRVSVIVALRVDFLARCGEVRIDGGARFLEDLAYDEAHRVFLRRMRDTMMRRVIEEPASRAGLVVNKGLIDAMLRDAGDEPGALPLLSYTLDQLWLSRDGDRLTAASYHKLGGVGGALEKKADEILASLDAVRQRAARRLFEQLVSIDEDERLDRRRRVPLNKFRRGRKEEKEVFEEVLELFVRERLVVRSEASESTQPAHGERAPAAPPKEEASPIIEVAHEQLLRSWKTLRAWVREDRQMLMQLRELEQWVKDAKSYKQYVLDPDRLSKVKGLLNHYVDDMNDDVKSLIERSEAAVTRRRYRIAATVLGGLAALVAILLLALWAIRRSSDARGAEAERLEAELRAKDAELERSAQVARIRVAGMVSGARELIAKGRPGAAVPLLLEVPDPERVKGWADVAAEALASAIPTLTLSGHQAAVVDVDFSPDGERLVSASEDKTVRLWKVDGSAPPVVINIDAGVSRARFSPDGRRVLLSCGDGKLRLWNADGSGTPIVMDGYTGEIAGRFSPDGSRVLGASPANTPRLWRVDGSGGMVELSAKKGHVMSASFSPDGSRVVTTSDDGAARIWKADGSGAPTVLKASKASKAGVVFAEWSPVGDRILTVNADGAARLWNADGSGKPLVLPSGRFPVLSAHFEPTGVAVVMACVDGVVRIVNADGSGLHEIQDTFQFKKSANDDIFSFSNASYVSGGEAVLISYQRRGLSVHPLAGGAPFLLEATSFVTSPDASTIAVFEGSAAAASTSVDLWSLKGRRTRLTLLTGVPITSAAWSADGHRIAILTSDSNIRLWDVRSPAASLTARAFDGRDVAVGFSRDGSRVLTSKTINIPPYLWSADGTGEASLVPFEVSASVAISPDGSRVAGASGPVVEVLPMNGQGNRLLADPCGDVTGGLSFSPDGKLLGGASADRTVCIWDSQSEGPAKRLKGHEEDVKYLDFSPDSDRLVTASTDKTARLWRVDGAGDPIILRGHSAGLLSARFSPDGARVVTTSEDRTARIWKADGTGEAIVLGGHDDSVTGAAFSPDGEKVVTICQNGTARVFRADGKGGDPILLRGHRAALLFAAWGADNKSLRTVDAEGRVREWTLSIGVLRERLQKIVTDCLAPDLRHTYLGEPDADAAARYEKCERARGRVPFLTYRPPPR